MAKRKLKARKRSAPGSKGAGTKRLKAKRRGSRRGAAAVGLCLPAKVLVEGMLGGVIVTIKRADVDDPHAALMSFTIKGASVRSEDRAIIVYGEFKEELRRVLKKRTGK